MSHNEEISKFLKKIAIYYLLEGDERRYITFQRAADNIYLFDKDIISGTEAQEKIEGVGKSIALEIDEFLNKGTSQRLKSLEAENPEFYKTYESLAPIYGMGIKRIYKYYLQGIRTHEDLKDRATDLKRKEKIYLKYYNELVLKATREEIEKFKNYFELCFDEKFIWEITGSYRRGSTAINDIDLLIVRPKDNDCFNILNVLSLLSKENIILEPISLGEERAVIILKINGKARQVDITLVEEEEFPFALIHTTGPRNLNIYLRRKAKEKDLTLNEYGLFDSTGKRIELKEEKEIFEFLDLPYIPPSERNVFSYYLK